LASASLTLAQVPAGSFWRHIFLDGFPDPLGFGFAPSRFSDPRKNPPRRFGAFYCRPDLRGRLPRGRIYGGPGL